MADLSKIKLNGTTYNFKDAEARASTGFSITSSDISNWNNKVTTETDPTVPSWAKASTKPSYTYSEVGASASDHVHGNIRNDGSITINTSLANGDRLVFSDTSDSYKIKNSSITFGTSTTQYLANNGTWQENTHGNITAAGDITATATIASGDRIIINDESASKVINSSITFGTATNQYLANNGTWQNLTVTQSLTSGTAVGTVLGTTLYAPNPYNDTALSNRVSALENLEWATYYSGRSNPASSLGQDGDIYLQY